MQTLEEKYKDDPELLAFYKERLLEPGWAGEVSSSGLTYIKLQLKLSRSLKRRWGFRPTAKRLSEKWIREVARDGLLRE